ncbi:MAG: replicative DNA helicase [Azospirillaceae bacterium]
MENAPSTNASSNIAILPTAERQEARYRQLPQNEEAEQALLGAILVNNEAIDRVSEFLEPEHFFFPAHGRIYNTCRRFREQSRVADPVSLKGYFESDGDLQDIGGAEYLAQLAASIVSVVNAVDYARTVYELFLRRSLIAIGEEIVNDAYKHDLDIEASAQLQAAEERLYKLGEEGSHENGFRAFSDILRVTIETAGKALNRDSHLTGITTGLVDLDKTLGGLQRSDLVVLAARPGMGKTSLATNIAFNAAKAYLNSGGREGAVVGFYSLEMSSEQLAVRILSEEARIASEKIRKGEMSKREDFPRLVEAAGMLERVPLFVDDTAGLTLTQLRTRALRLKRQHKLGMIVVDYLQLMRPSGSQRVENRVQEISEITRGLKMVAKDLDVPVLALSQLSRAVEQREDKRPQLADLRESGSIEQDADVVMFIFREAYYKLKDQPPMGTPEHIAWQQQMDEVQNLAQVIIAKQRHGPTGSVDLHFEGQFTRFSNLDRVHDASL